MNRKLLRFAILSVLLVFTSACRTVDKRSEEERFAERFERQSFKTPELILKYRLSRPKTGERMERYPLIVLLHGAGERGEDNERTLKHFLPLLRKQDFPIDRSYVLVPQSPERFRWVEVDWNLPAHRMPAEPSKPIKALLSLIDTMIQNERIDTSRIYVVGLSMGGFAVWDLLARRSDLFAAGVPVCGGGDEHAANVFRAPVWAFHGAKDQVVKVERSRNMVEALRRFHSSIRYTEYENEGHGSWKPAFQEKELLPWLLAQKRTWGFTPDSVPNK